MPRKKTGKRKSVGPKHLPTPEEIRQACLEIQKGWTDEERVRRTVLPKDENTYGAIHRVLID